MSRKRKSLPFEKAREIVQEEQIESVLQYAKWHDLNKPVGIPKRPDRAYKREFVSWNDYLGNNTPFPIKRKTYRPFNEARAFAQSLNISKKQEWLEICNKGVKPDDIPRRPDLYYRKPGEWISWGNFLGVTITARSETVRETKTIFFIIYNPKAEQHYFRCGLTNGGVTSINDFLTKINGRVVAACYVPHTFSSQRFLNEYKIEEHYEYKGYYLIPQDVLLKIISELSINFEKVRS